MRVNLNPCSYLLLVLSVNTHTVKYNAIIVYKESYLELNYETELSLHDYHLGIIAGVQYHVPDMIRSSIDVSHCCCGSIRVVKAI